MLDFSASSVWGFLAIFAVLLLSLLVANAIKKLVRPLEASLIPTSVLGGVILLVFAWIYKLIFKVDFFETALFNDSGLFYLESITYHTLALGFIAASLKNTAQHMNKQRTAEIFNTGVTTVATYLIQGIFGLLITIVASLIVKDFFAAAGLLLPFGFGQGTGQAMNYGNIYETDFGFVGGKNFGLTVAALGFLSASFGGVIHLMYLKRRGIVKVKCKGEKQISGEEIQSIDEIPMQESIDKFTVQVALIIVSYFLAFLLMFGLGKLLPGMKSLIYGFNFLIGVLTSSLIKVVLNLFKKAGVVKKEYINNFLLTRASNFFYDIMVVAGIAAIRLEALKDYWVVLIILGVVGLVTTYAYNRFVAHVLFPHYKEQQFLAMYGMLTGTASTGVILLREIDGEFETPASDNLVYQNFPAIAFGFPIMLVATLAPVRPWLTLGLIFAYFVVLNLILFRKQLFGKRSKKNNGE
jgi:ESS family glutamate:Na+ symporter